MIACLGEAFCYRFTMLQQGVNVQVCSTGGSLCPQRLRRSIGNNFPPTCTIWCIAFTQPQEADSSKRACFMKLVATAAATTHA